MARGHSLRLHVHRVTSLTLATETSFQGGHLRVSAEEAAGILQDPALGTVGVTPVSPGDSARIVKILDAVEPRTKGPGGGGIFPGFLAPDSAQATGDTHVLRGAAVVVAGHLPRGQEAVVDMSGPAADLSHLGCTHNLVIEFEPAEGAAWKDVDDALRRGSLRLAAHLAGAALDTTGDAIEELAPPHEGGSGASSEQPPRERLPRVGTITNLQTQGVFKDVFVRGTSLAGKAPMAIDPRELDDGAVVGGQYGHPGLRNNTFMHQNNPVVAALRERDGVDLEFAGVILAPEPVEQSQKETVSRQAAELCRELGWDAVVVTKEGAGNADADMSLKMDALEDMGITAVGIFAEMSGREGEGPPLVVPPERATAMVSTGNYDERLVLPAVDRAVGGARLNLAAADATAQVEIPTAVILGSLSPLGWGRLTASSGA